MTEREVDAEISTRPRVAHRVVLAGLGGGAAFGFLYVVASAIATESYAYAPVWIFVLPAVTVIAGLGGLGSAASALAVRALVGRISRSPIVSAASVAAGSAAFIVVGYLMIPGVSSTAPAVAATAALVAAAGLSAAAIVRSPR